MRTGADFLDQIQRSVVAPQHVLAIAVIVMHRVVVIAVAVAIARMPVPGVIVVVMGAIAIIGRLRHATFAIDRIRREIAGAGIGRALIGVIILLRRRSDMILVERIGQPLIGPAAAIAAVVSRLNRSHVDLRLNVDLRLRAWADIGLSARRAAALEQTPACHRGHSARGYHGECRYQSGNRLTHYSLLWVGLLLGWFTADACGVF